MIRACHARILLDDGIRVSPFAIPLPTLRAIRRGDSATNPFIILPYERRIPSYLCLFVSSIRGKLWDPVPACL